MSELDQKLSPYVDRFVDQTLIELDYPITEENRNIVAKNVGEGGEFYQEFRTYAANEMRREELKPTLGEYRERDPERRAQYLARERGMPFQEAYQSVLSNPFTVESDLYGSGSTTDRIANLAKDQFSGLGRSLLGLQSLATTGTPSGMATTPEASKQLGGSLLSNPSLPAQLLTGGMAPAPTTLAGRFGLGGLMGGLEASQKSFRPEGVETGEALTDIGLGAFGEGAMAIGSKMIPQAKQALAKWALPDENAVQLIEYARKPENLRAMADNLGMDTKIAKDLVESVSSPNIAPEMEVITRSVANMPEIDLSKVTKAMREANKVGGVKTEGYAKALDDLDRKISFIEDQVKVTRNSLTNAATGSPMKPAEDLVKLRQLLDDDINFTKMGEAMPAPIEKAYKAGRSEIRKLLLESAEKSGDKAYAEAMKELANKLDANSEMKALIGRSVGPSSIGRAESLVRNLEGTNKYKKEILDNYDKLFGTDFATKGQAVSSAKKLGFSESGLPNTTVYTTGKGGLIKDLLTGGPRRTAGVYYPALDALSNVTQTPSLGAIAFPQANEQIRSILSGYEDQGGY